MHAPDTLAIAGFTMIVNTAAVNDADIIQCDLDGGGEQKYRACFGMGPSTPSFYGAALGDLAGPILPWPDGE